MTVQQDILQLQLDTTELDLKLNRKTQEIMDSLSANTVKIQVNAEDILVARDLANTALSRQFGIEMAARIYTDTAIQARLDEYVSNLTLVKADLQSILTADLVQKINAILPDLNSTISAVDAKYEADIDALGEAYTESITATNALLDSTVPDQNNLIQLLNNTLTDTQAQIDLLVGGYEFPDLGSGFDQTIGIANDARAEADTAIERSRLTSIAARRGTSLLIDEFLSEEDYTFTRYTGAGTLTKVPNLVYPQGQTFNFVVTEAQRDGVYLGSPIGWPGPIDGKIYRVTVEFTLLSGTLSGAGALIQWRKNDVGTNAYLNFVDAFPNGVPLGKPQIVTGFILKPDSVEDDVDENRVFLMANFSGHGPESAKEINFHRISVRLAAAEEIGEGQVRAAFEEYAVTSASLDAAIAAVSQSLTTSYEAADSTITGQITDLKALNVSGTTAFGTLLTQLQVTSGGNSAYLSSIGTAVTDIQGNAAINYVFRGAIVGAVAEMELFAQNAPNGDPTSGIRFRGDNIIALGTLSSDALLVGMRRNLMHNTDFDALGLKGLQLIGSGQVETDSNMYLRVAGATWASPIAPSANIYQGSSASSGSASIWFKDPKLDGSFGRIPVEGLQNYEWSAYLSAHRCNCVVAIGFYDINNNFISGSFAQSPAATTQGSSSNPLSWERKYVIVTAPSNAAYAQLEARKWGTLAGFNDSHMFVFRPMFAETHARAVQPTAYSPPDTTIIDGGRFMTRSATADFMIAGSITAELGLIGNLAVNTLEIADEAVIVPVRVYSTNNIMITSHTSAVDVIVASMNREAGYVTDIDFSCSFDGNFASGGGTNITFKVYRNGTQFREFSDGMDKARKGTASFTLTDTNTSGGNTTYRVKVLKVDPSRTEGWDLDARILTRHIRLVQFKK